MKKKGGTEPLPSAVRTSDALYSIWSALEANPKQLAARLRQGDASKAEMALAANLIEAIIKPRRPRSSREERLIIAEHVRWIERLRPTFPRKKVIRLTVEHFKDRGQRISARHVYNALAEFDRITVARINRLPENENERGLAREPNKRLRKDLEACSRDLLYEIIEGLLDRA